jgi:hypothetical protein
MIGFLRILIQNTYLFVDCLSSMRKLLTIVKALFDRKVSIESVGKTAISKSPGDVTEIRHN